LQLQRAGKIRPLAYAGTNRHADFPDVPTFAEQGYPTVDFHLQMLMLAPAGLAPDITLKLSAALANAMRSTELRAQLQAIGIEPTWGGAASAAALIAQDTSRFAPVLSKSSAKAD
jgi:tripartite-type tricarboxylate transporter receptor subunit TctC